ncbi:hypothetical protein [Brevundimonas sp.]|uniref:hypothetical protein n=1 Tax=Brevundimonas sp. TaxID=1871086 RepID=UPI0035B491FB
MLDLWIFTGLLLVAGVAAFFSRSRFLSSLRVGVGGPDENLSEARRLYRSILTSGLVFVAAATSAMFIGLRGVDVWRTTGVGQVVLNVLLAIAAIGFFRSFARTFHHQWSAKGSFLGVLRETFFGFVTGGLLMLAMYLRWGL